MERTSVKLYEPVIVQHAEYSHFGQVLSRVTPTDTVMVRMVPGYAATLKEMPLSALREADLGQRPMYVHYAAVKGRSSFPIDMLRYDMCAPLNFDPETRELDTTFGFSDFIVARLGPLFWEWTDARWSSFAWTLTRLNYERFYKDRI